ncbi:MAG TPA: DUF4184 family protein [Myxococcota bacterium]|jgi:hypothetical protein|nr:DUF4184 family protein [Myxococcota bacterium]
MPFTLAHPAAAVPLQRRLGRFGVLSALVIGSMVPDVAYFVPLGVTRAQSHSVAGLLWWCLPAGLALYALFHAVLSPALVALAPRALRARVAPIEASRTPPQLLAICVSLLVGATTHIVWDSFTHDSGPMVHAIDWLRLPLGTIWGYRLYTYRLIQHGSSVLGLLWLALQVERWWRRTPAAAPVPDAVPRRVRIATLAAIATATLVTAGVEAAPRVARAHDLSTLRPAVGCAVTTAMSASGISILLYALAWHVWRRVR